ncbi:hypothetical protein BH24ACT3_BH24ACT3_06160 [soil metagenome]
MERAAGGSVAGGRWRSVTSDVFSWARDFVEREGRVLERRLFATLFEGADPAGVVAALLGYGNVDGGFGHGLEPDKLCPDSQPLDVEIAFEVMAEAGAVDREVVEQACDFLVSVSDDGGAVPIVLPSVARYPRAAHWAGDNDFPPSLNPTAGLAAHLHQFGVAHPWRDGADAYCFATLEAEVPASAHSLSEALAFLEHAPDRARAEVLVAPVRDALDSAEWFRWDADDPGYGLTPVHLAPTPDSRWASLFDEALVDAHLARLLRDQQPDGGWSIAWEPPSAAAVLAWRVRETIRALTTLRAYRRIAG